MVTVTNFTLPIKVPSSVTDHAVLRVRYISNNPLEIDPANNTAAVFYNCADIKITDADDQVSPLLAPDEQLLPTAKEPSTAFANDPTSFSCTPPPLFHAYGETVSRAGGVVHEIWYQFLPSNTPHCAHLLAYVAHPQKIVSAQYQMLPKLHSPVVTGWLGTTVCSSSCDGTAAVPW